MDIKIFKGFEEIYPEKIEGTDSWYYGQWTPCSEAYEVPCYKNKYPGTKLYLIEFPSGKVYEPIKQEMNVFLERPVYDNKDNLFGIIRYDFNKEVIQVLSYKPEWPGVKTITEIPFSKAGDLVNIRLIVSPFALVKHDIQNDAVEFIWPEEKRYELEKNESLYFQDGGRLYLTKKNQQAIGE